MHIEKWKSQRNPSEFENKGVKEFYESIIKNTLDKGLNFSVLWCNENIVSIHFGFLYKKWLFWYKPAYNKDFEKFSPGKIHLFFLTKYGIENKFKGIDLLQGDEKYKFSWANKVNYTETLMVNLGDYKFKFWWNTKVRNF